MLRRFNSLIKSSKVQPDLAEHVSLRPTRSVDSASIRTHVRVDPLQVARTGNNLGDGQPSVSNQSSYSVSKPSEGAVRTDCVRQERNSLISRVPEERSWKDGYEYGKLNLDSPGVRSGGFAFAEKSDFHAVDFSDAASHQLGHEQSSNERAGDNAEQNELVTHNDGESTFRSVPEPTRHNLDESIVILRTSSNEVPAGGDEQPNGSTTIDIPDAETGKAGDLESLRKVNIRGTIGPPRTISTFSTDSMSECCRICQQHTEEELIDLGCFCRGDLAKAHKPCIEQWFSNKGTNKCEVCQHVATNIPAPSSEPMPHFWVWRVGGPYAGPTQAPRAGIRGVGIYSRQIVIRPVMLMVLQRHPSIVILWVLLLAFMTYLFIDAINASTIGYAAMPIGFIFGVLVVLGLGTAARLVLECWHERTIRRSIRRMEMTPIVAELHAVNQPVQSQAHTAVNISVPAGGITGVPSQVNAAIG